MPGGSAPIKVHTTNGRVLVHMLQLFCAFAGTGKSSKLYLNDARIKQTEVAQLPLLFGSIRRFFGRFVACNQINLAIYIYPSFRMGSSINLFTFKS